MNLYVEFETKSNQSYNQTICYKDVSGTLVQETDKFVVSLNGDEEVENVLRCIWEMTSLYGGYFYVPITYIVDGIERNIEDLYFLMFYKKGKLSNQFAYNLVGAGYDFSEERIAKYIEFRNCDNKSDVMQRELLFAFFYLHSESYESINVNHRLSLLLNICDGFVINTSGDNKDVKFSIKTVIGKAIDPKAVKYGAELMGISRSKMYDALANERNEIDHYVHKDGSLSDYARKSNCISRDYIIWYFIYIIELALRISFLNQIGCQCSEELISNVVARINDWVILECDLPVECKMPGNQLRQKLKKRGMIIE